MRNKPWKLSTNRLKVFALVLCVCELSGCHGSKSDTPSASVANGFSSHEGIQKLQENPGTVLDVESSSSRPWVSKCCNLTYGFVFEDKSVCVKTEHEFLPDFEDWPDYSQYAKILPVKTRYEYYMGDPCLHGKYILDVATYPDDKYSIYTNGTLLHFGRLHDKEEFCLETLNGTIRAFVCFDARKTSHELNFTFIIYAASLVLSIPFLLATALIYLCVENFRDLRGKSLSCHVLCLATGYLFLAIVQLSSDQLENTFCIAAGFIIQFFFVAAFFWLNVISYDTWRCMNDDFRCIYRAKNSPSEKVIFCSYSLYGWYGPVILSIVTLVMDLEPAIPESYLKPKFGLRSCWFYSDDAALPYFYGPVAIIIFINIIFFFLSARKIYLQQKRKKEYEARKSNSAEEIREIELTIKLYVKTLQECIYLFCIMGINWIAEVLSWAIGGSQAIWLITDIFNALQGVLIFYLFVIKPTSVRNEVKHRVCIIWEKITRCNRHNERVRRSLSVKPCYEMETCSDSGENDKFLSQSGAVTPVATAV